MFDALNTLLLLFILIVPAFLFLVLMRELLEYLKQSILILLMYLSLCVLYFNKLLFSGQTLMQSDFNNIQAVLLSFFRNSILKQGSPPIWNTAYGGGFDAYSNPLSAYLSPLNNVLLLFNDFYFALNIFLLLQVFLALVFFYLMFKEFKFSKSAAFLGSMVAVFNGFLAMRLSPGVGTEYFFTYKWLPLLLIFTSRYVSKDSRKNFLLLSIVFGFLFVEGNLNISIAISILWVFFILFHPSSKFNVLKKAMLLFVPPSALLLFSVKFLPAFHVILTSAGRISSQAEGWRIERMKMSDFFDHFLPIQYDFLNSIFTPGLLGLAIFVTGLIFYFITFAKSRKNYLLNFSIFLLVVSFILVTRNPVSWFVFSLPILNRLTIIPSFYVFLLLPISVFSAYGGFALKTLLDRKINYKRVSLSSLVLFFISTLIFLEVLLGPSSLGTKTYSFNFPKLNYIQEPYSYPAYKILKTYPKGNFIFTDAPVAFNYTYAVYMNNLFTLNYYKYFFGNTDDSKLLNDWDGMKIHANYLLSPDNFCMDGLEFLESYNYDKTRRLESFFVHTDHESFLNFSESRFWDGYIYLYKSLGTDKSSLKLLNDNTVKYELEGNTANYDDSGNLITSISYSDSWVVNRPYTLFEDSYGYLGVSGTRVGEKVKLEYRNKLIYLGLIISLFSFGYFLFVYFKKDNRN